MKLTSSSVARHVGGFLAAGTLLVAAAAGAADSASQAAPSASGSAPPHGKGFQSGTTMKRLADAGTIRVGIKFDQPLFGLMGLDGKPSGHRSPANRIPLPAGVHTLRLVNPTVNLEKRATVTIRADENLPRYFNLVLDR